MSIKKRTIVLITGLSGAGKSAALASLEDIGFFCIDNLPIFLLDKFLSLTFRSSDVNIPSKFAFCVDVRSKDFSSINSNIFFKLKKKFHLSIIYLYASKTSLLKRFNETRRKHPLVTKGRSVEQALDLEEKELNFLREQSDIKIDTTNLTIHDLKNVLSEFFSNKDKNKMRVEICSFGYKYGIPDEFDLIFDVRFLPNPFFNEEFKNLTGTDSRILKFMLKAKTTKIFLNKFTSFLEYLLPLYEKEGRMYLNIGIGCTGGKHRSVAVAEYIYNNLKTKNKFIKLNHRDVNKE
jgi:UPF0042 nucleotide-binding protein